MNNKEIKNNKEENIPKLIILSKYFVKYLNKNMGRIPIIENVIRKIIRIWLIERPIFKK